MKQKIVIKLQPNCDKCRSKAMTLAAEAGVDSVKMEGENRDKLVVIGEGVDPSNLTKALRRKVGHADIIEVNEVKKEEKKEKTETIEYVPWEHSYHPQGPRLMVYDSPSTYSNPNFCSIM